MTNSEYKALKSLREKIGHYSGMSWHTEEHEIKALESVLAENECPECGGFLSRDVNAEVGWDPVEMSDCQECGYSIVEPL